VGRILFFVVLAAALYFLLRGTFRSRVKPPPATRSPEGEGMVACARCGVNLPRSSAAAQGERWVCADNPHCR
jgi:uncharacterized protein